MELPAADPDTLLRVHELARWFKVSTRTARRWIALGNFPSVRVGRCVRVPAAAVRKVIEEQSNAGRS